MWCVGFGLAMTACASSSRGSSVTTSDGEEVPPEEAMEVMEVEVVVEKCRVPELKTYFAFDSDQVAQHENLDALAECLVSGPLRGHTILLRGHTDPQGDETYNVQLGLSRAQQVAAYLVAKGVSEDRIKYRSLGPSEASDDPADFPRDRRVDIDILL